MAKKNSAKKVSKKAASGGDGPTGKTTKKKSAKKTAASSAKKKAASAAPAEPVVKAAAPAVPARPVEKPAPKATGPAKKPEAARPAEKPVKKPAVSDVEKRVEKKVEAADQSAPAAQPSRQAEEQCPPEPFMEHGATIPSHYGEDRLVCMERDPMWLYCYWELEGGAVQKIIDARGQAFLNSCSWVLRVQPEGSAPYDLEIDPIARNWYLNVSANTRYEVELGVRSPEGEYIPIVSGNAVRTAPARAGSSQDESWREWQEELAAIRQHLPIGSSSGVSGASALVDPRLLRRAERRRRPQTKPTVSGYLLLVLHAHLPYVRHPEHERFLEEDWLFEAITETYVPLAQALLRLESEQVHPRLTMTITPPLCEMMADPLLQKRYVEHMQRLIVCAERLYAKHKGGNFESAAEMYVHRLRDILEAYRGWGNNPLTAFRGLQDRGVVEILTCGATHGLMPLMQRWESIRAQIETAARNYEKHFGHRPEGIWLPECAYRPGVDQLLADSGIRYFFMDSHGVLNAAPQPKYLTYRPVMTPAGVAVFARDAETGVQVWSAESGYPGDPVYREFYRDQGYDGDIEDVGPCLHTDQVRRSIGLKFHRVTGKVQLHEKEPYVPAWARHVAGVHARNFVDSCHGRVDYLANQMGAKPVVCAMYDAELFGHWWYEGIDFLEGVLRNVGHDLSRVEPVLPSEFLGREKDVQMVTPSASSWGDKGYFGHWLNGTNDWIYPHLHKAEERMGELARRFTQPTPLERRTLNQAARELLLAQSSDWAFLIATRTAPNYATRRTRDHVAQFTRLYEQLMSGRIDEADVSSLENRDAIFQEIDYTIYA